jgi:FkbM family methyltransferase
VGLDLVRYPQIDSPERQRAAIMRQLDIELVADVGANVGQYIETLRANGYTGQIVAFEPLSHAYQLLVGKPGVTAHRVAIGSETGETTINVSKDSQCSSLLATSDTLLQAAPQSAYISEETVPVRTLDSFGLDADWVKIDTQGYEREAINGGKETLRKARGVEVELSYVPLYKGQPLAHEIHTALEQLGFKLVGYGWTFNDPATGALLQIDALFTRI